MAAPKKLLPATDKDVQIPAAVTAAAARSNEIHKQYYEQPAPEAPPEAPEPVAEQPEAPPEPAPAPAVVEPSKPDVTSQGNDQSWEHKYNSMKGRFERSETANRSMSERISGMEQTLAAMSAAAPLPKATNEPAESLITAEEMAEWGPEMLDVIGRRAREQISPEVKELRSQIENLNERLQNVGGHMAQDARSRMMDQLNTAVSNWQEVNSNQKFLNWLALPDSYSGAIRDQLLQAAYTANDGPRVLAFFKGFLAEEAALSPQENLPAPVAHVAQVPLETLAAPGRAKTAATLVPAEKPNFTRAQVAKFFADVSRGFYRGRDADKLRIDKEISDAAREGRIK